MIEVQNMNNSEKTIPELSIVGIELRTDNSEDGIKKIGAHWKRFYADQILQHIPNRKNDDIVALYTDYEGDHTKPYSFILGAEVTDAKTPPDGMVLKKVPAQKYAVFIAKGPLPQALVQKWQEIWDTNIQKRFSADFELYGKESNKGDKSEVSIYIAIN
jgi:predicted transcriptional regulator YdeE